MRRRVRQQGGHPQAVVRSPGMAALMAVPPVSLNRRVRTLYCALAYRD